MKTSIPIVIAIIISALFDYIAYAEISVSDITIVYPNRYGENANPGISNDGKWLMFERNYLDKGWRILHIADISSWKREDNNKLISALSSGVRAFKIVDGKEVTNSRYSTWGSLVKIDKKQNAIIYNNSIITKLTNENKNKDLYIGLEDEKGKWHLKRLNRIKKEMPIVDGWYPRFSVVKYIEEAESDDYTILMPGSKFPNQVSFATDNKIVLSHLEDKLNGSAKVDNPFASTYAQTWVGISRCREKGNPFFCYKRLLAFVEEEENDSYYISLRSYKKDVNKPYRSGRIKADGLSITNLSFSPDGEFIAFYAMDKDDIQYLYVVDVKRVMSDNKNNVYRLKEYNLVAKDVIKNRPKGPIFSPEGKYLFYLKNVADKRQQSYIEIARLSRHTLRYTPIDHIDTKSRKVECFDIYAEDNKKYILAFCSQKIDRDLITNSSAIKPEIKKLIIDSDIVWLYLARFNISNSSSH